MRVLVMLAAIAGLGADACTQSAPAPKTATEARPLIEAAARKGCECAMRAYGDKRAAKRCWHELETLKRRYKTSSTEVSACWPGPASACFNENPGDQPRRADSFCVLESIGTPVGDVCTMEQAETVMTIYSAKGPAAAKQAVAALAGGERVMAIAGASKGCGDEVPSPAG